MLTYPQQNPAGQEESPHDPQEPSKETELSAIEPSR